MVRFIFLVLLTILLIVRLFVKVLKWYCWDKSRFHHKDLNNFCIESVCGFLTQVLWAIPDSFGQKFVKIKVLFLSHFRKTIEDKLVFLKYRIEIFFFQQTLPFVCPRDRRSGDILFFVLSVILSFRHFVILLFCKSVWNLNFADNFWTVKARALIIHMGILWDKNSPWVPTSMTLWSWPWSMAYFLNTLTLFITFI